MNWPLLLALLWLLSANVLAMIPSKDNHWQRAYILIALGVPLLIWLTYENGLLIGVMFLLAAASVLRWPVIYLMRWLRGRGRDYA